MTQLSVSQHMLYKTFDGNCNLTSAQWHLNVLWLNLQKH